jgi:C-terminal processing protease CtpA/Prc
MTTIRNDQPRRGWRGLAAAGLLALLAGTAAGCTVGAAEGAGQPAGRTADDVAIENVRALAHLYGHVRYFHPSDEAASVDWDRFLVHGVRIVRDAATPEELRRRLESIFLPIAPTLQIHAERDAPARHPLLVPADTSGLQLVVWQHRGVGLGNPGRYSSVRLNRLTALPLAQGFATVTQAVDATPYRGQQLRLEAAVRVAVSGPGNQAQLWLRVDRPQEEMGFFDNMMDRPIVDAEWRAYAIVGSVAPDAQRIVFGGLLAGAGEASFDAFRMQVRRSDAEPWQDVALANPGFEEGSEGQLPGWGGSGGQTVSATDVAPFAGRRAARIRRGGMTPAQPLFAQRPGPGEVAERPLGRGLLARVPLALYSRDDATLPAADPAPAAALAATLAGVESGLTAADPTLRAAAVIAAWNVFQHFYPYFDVVDVDWDATLTATLHRAEQDRDERAFLRTLRWMVARLDDGHGNVFHRVDQSRAGLPLRLEQIEGQIAVVALTHPDVETCVRVGDVLVAVDGVAVADALREDAAHISGSPHFRTLRAVQELGRGERETEAVLRLGRDGAALECHLTRTQQTAPAEPRPAPIAELADGVMYVDLDRAELSAIQQAMGRLADARGVIFDLRGYPRANHDVLRHLSPDTLRSAHWQVPQRIRPAPASLEGYDTSGRWSLPPAEPRLTGRIIFLTDARAISYAESVLGIVEHYRLGDIVGAPTAGANGNVNPFTIPGGYRISWTGMRVVKHDGSQHHLVGIRPTVPVERTLRALRERRDEHIERALELIQGGRPR